jgi:hypothetical protein
MLLPVSLAELSADEIAVRDSLYATLSSVVLEYEERAQAVHESQLLFSNQLDMLQRELGALAEFGALPSLEKHIRSLSDAKRRLQAVNESIAVIAERLRRISTLVANNGKKPSQ